MGANNTRLSPRQKMINLMYIVLTAMLALNVSSDVLDGFTQVHEGLKRSNVNFDNRNASLYAQLSGIAEQNPDKAQAWLDKATQVRENTAALYRYVDSLKYAIVRKADGENGDPDRIQSRDDLEAAAVTMLSGTNPQGKVLRLRVDDYRDFMVPMMPDSLKRATIVEALSTAPIPKAGNITPLLWEEAKFDQQPVVAAVTLLSKLQSDILFAEGEVLVIALVAAACAAALVMERKKR